MRQRNGEEEKGDRDNRVKYSPVSNWSVLNKHKLITSHDVVSASPTLE